MCNHEFVLTKEFWHKRAFSSEWKRGQWCRKCANARNRAGYKKNTKARLDSAIKARYGISPDEYKAMVEAQGNKCAICLLPEPRKLRGKENRLGIDHCHKTGMVRGLLCTRCNSGLGFLMDDVEILLSAVSYLRRYTNGDG